MAADSVSVVVPAYRAEPFIGRVIGSVLRQSWTDFEVVIASDDGVDYVALLAKQGVSDARLRRVFTGGIGTGPANARNTGLDAASGRIIATVDADDTLEPNALEVFVPLARAHGAAYSRRRFIDGATEIELESLDRPISTGPLQLEDILTSQIHSYAGIVFDRDRVTARWPAWRELWEDVYFYVKCFDDLESIFHVSEPLYDYYRMPGSLCNQPDTGQAHLDSARRLLARLDQGDTLDLKNPHSRIVFQRYLSSRITIEEDFIRASAEGRFADFHSFTRERLDLFYRLD